MKISCILEEVYIKAVDTYYYFPKKFPDQILNEDYSQKNYLYDHNLMRWVYEDEFKNL